MQNSRVFGLLLMCMCLLSLVSCGSSTNPLDTVCGKEQTVEVGKTGNVILTPASPNFLLSTPRTAGSHCQAIFTLEYEWADSARRKNDDNEPKLISSYSPFHVNQDLTYFNDYTSKNEGADILGHDGHSWTIFFADSHHEDTASMCTYYIKFSMSGVNADSIRVHGRIDYHEPL